MTTRTRVVLGGAALAALAGAAATTAATATDGAPGSASRAEATSTVSSPAEFTDARRDVGKRALDLRKVRVVNKPGKLKVRLVFPGVEETYDFPIGYLSVWLDTDKTRKGAEYGHFMQFWSDYRFAETKGWRETPSPEWSHSPDGECVQDAGVRSDKLSRLRYFEFIVRKHEGCFEADAVRIAVSTVNEGRSPHVPPYATPYVDHLDADKAWTKWVTVQQPAD